jgi:hypothetical protein
MRNPNHQRCHYSSMARQEGARREAIRALVILTQFPDDVHAAIQCLRTLEAAPDEIETELRSLRSGKSPAVDDGLSSSRTTGPRRANRAPMSGRDSSLS